MNTGVPDGLVGTMQKLWYKCHHLKVRMGHKIGFCVLF